jgi:hypothetical protein
LVKLATDSKKDANAEEIKYRARYLASKYNELIAARQRISILSNEVYNFLGANYLLLSTIPSAIQSMREAENSLSNISRKMWFSLPILAGPEEHMTKHFIEQINTAHCKAFIRSTKTHIPRMQLASGGLRGQLLSPVINQNFSTLRTILKDKKQFDEVMKSKIIEK